MSGVKETWLEVGIMQYPPTPGGRRIDPASLKDAVRRCQLNGSFIERVAW